jgi:integrase
MRKAENLLRIREIKTPQGTAHQLYGNIQTAPGVSERIREISPDLAALMERKNALEIAHLEIEARKVAQTAVQSTSLPVKRLRIFEAVNEAIPAHLTDEEVRLSLMQWVGRLTEAKTITCSAALVAWEDNANKRRRRDRTVRDNRNAVLAYLREFPAKYLHEILPSDLEDWVLAEGIAFNTQVTRGRRLHAWLQFCVDKEFIRENPLKVDLDELVDSAAKHLAEDPRILTAAQCHRLLAVAREYENGLMVPYVILATWCFMRNAEVVSTTREQIIEDDGEMVVNVRGIKKGTAATRSVIVPENVRALLKRSLTKLAVGQPVPFSPAHWNNVRENAGLIKREAADRTEAGNMSWRVIKKTAWQENILRHTGVSYRYKFDKDIDTTTAEAGHSVDTAFKHYIALATTEDAKKFYAPIPKVTTIEAKPAEIIAMSA